jgi:hypothetical protein
MDNQQEVMNAMLKWNLSLKPAYDAFRGRDRTFSTKKLLNYKSIDPFNMTLQGWNDIFDPQKTDMIFLYLKGAQLQIMQDSVDEFTKILKTESCPWPREHLKEPTTSVHFVTELRRTLRALLARSGRPLLILVDGPDNREQRMTALKEELLELCSSHKNLTNFMKVAGNWDKVPDMPEYLVKFMPMPQTEPVSLWQRVSEEIK